METRMKKNKIQSLFDYGKIGYGNLEDSSERGMDQLVYYSIFGPQETENWQNVLRLSYYQFINLRALVAECVREDQGGWDC
jgi:hypothetical protein